jgi:hypothetical protein
MIISASRRTDIPAFYAEWFMNRIRDGYAIVPNPVNPRQTARVSLRPEDVDAIVFWTRHPLPLLPVLPELDGRGYRYYFQYTLMDNPRAFDPHTPALADAVATFRELSERIGPRRVIWRYDPIVFSTVTGADFHLDAFGRIAALLAGHTRRAVISIADDYRHTAGRMAALREQGIRILKAEDSLLNALMPGLVASAQSGGMEVVSCAEAFDLRRDGVAPGKCIDDDLIRDGLGVEVGAAKDPRQRPKCLCVASKDIGAYDTCVFGCRYCYATRSFDVARRRLQEHDPRSPSLVATT